MGEAFLLSFPTSVNSFHFPPPPLSGLELRLPSVLRILLPLPLSQTEVSYIRALLCDQGDGLSDGNLLVSWGQEIDQSR